MMDHFPKSALETLDAAYPEAPVKLAHNLSDHPMFALEELVALAGRLRPVDVEYNRADLPIGINPDDVPDNGMDIEATIRSIEENGSWMVLKFIEQDAAYHDLLHDVLAGIVETVRPSTGEMLKREGFIFISSPGAVTPFHMDPEHNILCQIRGMKTMTVFPAGDPRFADGEAHERFHAGGHRNLTYNDKFADDGVPFELRRDEAIYVPVKAPHWVQNGPEVSISLSVTWRSEWSYREEAAHGLNSLIRKAGLTPTLPGRFPAQNHGKSLAWRAISKAKRTLGRS